MNKLIYEVIPPPKSWTFEQTKEWVSSLVRLLQKQQVHTVIVPEVVSESREGKRTVPITEKIDTFDFINLLLSENPSLTVIPNKITVYHDEKALLHWVEKAYKKGIRKLILVGGDKGSIHYPGLSVTDSASLIKTHYPNILLGGITIFTRKKEHRRIFKKMEHGIDFFVSQIIYETANMKCVLLNLAKLCEKDQRAVPRIYLSLAPAAKKSDIEFLQWLGVEFPTALHFYFMSGEENQVEERVNEMIDFVLEELRYFITRKGFDLGFNIERIMYNNGQNTINLLKHVKERLSGCL